MRGIPGNPWDIGAADADVGKFAVAQARQFVQALVVALPLLDEADECGKHDVSFFPIKSGRCRVSFAEKIGMFRQLKSNNVAPQLREKRIAKVTEN